MGALVGYSKQVGSLLVAEGIEHSAELYVLGELGVPLAQGYYTGRPGRPWPDIRTARPSAAESQSAPLGEPMPIDAAQVNPSTAGSLLPV